MDWDGKVVWEYHEENQHHDFHRLPNGNLTYLTRELMPEDAAARVQGGTNISIFDYPLPEVVATLRAAIYPPLAGIANCWLEAMGIDTRFPADHSAFMDTYHGGGQKRPTLLLLLLLKYGSDDQYCLHQDRYEDIVFALQMTVLLSESGTDFTGGDFVLTEQRPRIQSRAEVGPLLRGDAVIFPVNQRPVRGTLGFYIVTMRHGVSRARADLRYTLGVILHDAAEKFSINQRIRLLLTPV